MANERKIFPTEKVMELVTGKKDANINDIATHILGRPLPNRESLEAAAPYAAAWLARWYPKFMDVEWKDGDNWQAFLKQAKAKLGDNISIDAMQGRLKTLANSALDALKDAKENFLRQTDAATKLEQRVRELEPLENAIKIVQKKNDDLEEKIKTMKGEMAALNRKVIEFQGKMPIDNEELMQTIKDAIKDGLKGVKIGAAAPAAGGSTEAAAEPEPETTGEDDFGFGSRKTDDDGFGF